MADQVSSDDSTDVHPEPAKVGFAWMGAEKDNLIDALVEEFTDRMHAGEKPDVESYVARYPERAVQLKELLTWAEAVAHISEGSGAKEQDSNNTDFSCPHAQLSEFRLIREIGRGGMGVVYEAEQSSLGRRVALKVLSFAAMFDARQLQRFKNEARAVAKLDHPHIVSVYSVGFEQDVHFYAMQFVDGESLAEVISRWHESLHEKNPSHRIDNAVESDSAKSIAAAEGKDQQIIAMNSLPQTDRLEASNHEGTVSFGNQASRSIRLGNDIPESRLPHEKSKRVMSAVGWVIQAALALEHAHQKGIVHRDVKPSNLLVNRNGHLWVADFGLAIAEGDSGLTQTGDVPGTLRYMSPEQLSGDRTHLDHRTDIYSLGLTLFELLTLEPAFPETNRAALTKRIVEVGIRSPRGLNRAIPQELEQIIFKAVDRNASKRYQTAEEFADDLRRFSNSEPIQAKLNQPFFSPSQWMSWRPKLIAGFIGSLIVIAIFAIRRETVSLEVADFEAKTSLVKSLDTIDASPTAVDTIDSPVHYEVDDVTSKIREEWRSGSNSFEAGYFDAAISSLTRAIESYQEILAKRPANSTELLYGTLAETSMGRVLWKTGHLEESVPYLNCDLATLLRLNEQQKLNDRDRANAASVCFQIADLWLSLMLWEEAAECYRQGLAIAPDSMPVHREWMYLAYMTAASGDDEAYRAVTQEAYERYRNDNDSDVRCFLTQALCIGSNAGVDKQMIIKMADSPWIAPGAIDATNKLIWVTHAAQAHLGAGHLDRAEELSSQMQGLTLLDGVYSAIEAQRGRENQAIYWLERAEAARRDDARKILLLPPNATSMNDWAGFVNAQTCSIRAQRSLHRNPILANPWISLVKGRNHGLLKNYHRAENYLSNAVEVAAKDSDLLNARGRIFLELGWYDRGAEDFDRARREQPSIATSPHSSEDVSAQSTSDPFVRDRQQLNEQPILNSVFPANEPNRVTRSLIAEAHAWLERGDLQAAESRFTQTLSTTNSELDLFLQTDGWWLAGPFPHELVSKCLPESFQVLGQPIGDSGVIDATTEPKIVWRRMQSVGYGTVELWAHLPQDRGSSAYLLTYIYSPTARTINFHVGSDGPRRVWMNEHLLYTSYDVRNWDFETDPVPLQLQPGRNTLLVKLTGATTEKSPQQLLARLDDSPIDRARSLAAAYLFPEASDMFDLAFRRGAVRDISMAQWAAYAAAAAGLDQRFVKIREGLWEHDRHNPHDPYWTARAWLLLPGVPDQSERWLNVLQQGFQPPIDEGRNVRIHAALAHFRLGHYGEALSEIESVARNKYPHSWPIMAMILQKLGLSDAAAETLECATLWRRDFLSNFPDAPASEKPGWWGAIAEFETLYREACDMIKTRNPADNAWWQLAIARGHSRQGDREAAGLALRAIDEFTQTDHDLLAARGATYAEIHEFDLAVPDFELARESIISGPEWHRLSRHLTGAARAAELAGRSEFRDRFQQQASVAIQAAIAVGAKIQE